MHEHQKKAEVCEKRTFTLCKTVEVEEWLDSMAQNGLSLIEIKNSKFYFVEVAPFRCRHFLLRPESGTNSEAWVFYEFERNFGLRIPCSGSTILSPRLALVTDQEYVNSNTDLIEYYYDYRNYRLSRRLLRNGIFSFVFFLICAFIGFLGEWSHFIALLPYVLVSGVLSIHFWISFVRFLKSCHKYKWSHTLKKPRRPGY